ncbi:hypothetical protein DVH26_12115 [Paenibacillus sp. H1-7]|nr:hypothetical protein DVH26_12115 [Paenibacillus sp. H1-7]
MMMMMPFGTHAMTFAMMFFGMVVLTVMILAFHFCRFMHMLQEYRSDPKTSMLVVSMFYVFYVFHMLHMLAFA